MNTPATPRLKSIQRTALAFLVAAGVINYIDRATLAVANSLIREELGLSVAQMGYLLSAFLGAYALSQLPVGAMVDKGGPRLLLGLGLSLWSVAQALGGLVCGFWSFLGARVVLGIGEAPMFPTWCVIGSTPAIEEWRLAYSIAPRHSAPPSPFRC